MDNLGLTEHITTIVSGIIVGATALFGYLHQKKNVPTSEIPGNGGPGENLKSISNSISLPITSKEKTPLEIISNNIFIGSKPCPVGYVKKKSIAVYLDLHTASCDRADRKILAEALTTYVSEILASTAKNTIIATPREGNILLGEAVAAQIGIPFVMIRTVKAPRFGYPIEGLFNPSSQVILVEDICMEGAFLQLCVELLRQYGLNVSKCICLFERTDGNARKALSNVGVELYAKYLIDDQILRDVASSKVKSLDFIRS